MGNLPNKQIGWSQESNLLWEILKQLDGLEGTMGMLTDVVPSTRTITINGVTQDLSADRVWTVLGTAIGVVPSFSFLPTAPSVPGEFYWAENSEGTQWLPGALGGTYYNAGLYYSNGIEWTYMETPYQAIQAEVDAGVNFNKFLTPLTFENAAKWNTKQGTLTLTTLGSGGPATLIGDVLNIPVYTGGGGGGQTENFNWRFDTSTVAGDPGNGRFRANNATPSLVTELYVDSLCADTGFNIDNIFTNITGDWSIYVQQEGDATKFAQYTTSGPYTNNTGWWTIPVTFIQSGAGGGLTNNAKCVFYFVNKNSIVIDPVPTDGSPNAVSSDGVYDALQTKADKATILNINGNSYDLSASREWRVAQADTGALSFAGLFPNSATTINIGAVSGYVIDNETNPDSPLYTRIDYVGQTNAPVPTIGSGLGSYVMLGPDGIGGGIVSFQNTFPTSAERKAKIFLGKVAHPSGTITAVINEPDYILSPLSFSRDLFQVLGPYINDGVLAYPNGANLQVNITQGNLHGNGINFVNDNTNPNELTTGPFSPLSFLYRTSTGAGGGLTNTIQPGNYDLGGVITPVGGGANSSTLQYIFAVPGTGFIIQYGQEVHASLSAAIAAIGRESFTIFPNLIGNSILIGVIAVNKSATELDNLTQAQFFPADKFGQIIGATSGISTGTLQQAYDNSLIPHILTSVAGGALTLRRGTATDTDNVFVIENGAGTTTFTLKGNGNIAAGLSEFLGTTASDGGQLGTELASGTTASGTNWTGTNFGLGYTHTVGSTVALTGTLAAVVSTYYQIAYTITGRTAGSVTIAFGGQSVAGVTATGTFGPRATTTGVLTVTPTTDFDGTVAISIKTITPSSATISFKNSAGTVTNELRAFSSNTNTSIGVNAGSRITTGLNNTAFGTSAGLNNTTGNNWTAIGYTAGSSNTTGTGWTAIGRASGFNNTTGNNWTAIGDTSGLNNTTGSNWLTIGAISGRYLADGVTSATGFSNSTYVGIDTKVSANGVTNENVFGYNAIGNGSNTVTIGNSSITNNYFTGNIRGGAFIKAGGLSTQFLKADGSVDSNTYLTAEVDTLQTVTTRGAVTTTSITANSFIKTGGLSTEFLMADGSVTTGGGGSGSVTSVGLALPSIFSVTGSPVIVAGTLTGTLVSQAANTVFAAPNGSAGVPTFRTLVAADIPVLPYEPTIAPGTASQYYRGDKTFQTLNTTAVPEGTNLYYTEARVSANTDVAANTAARHNAVTLGTANGLSLATQVLSLGLSSTSTTGALSSTDWNTFNNKISTISGIAAGGELSGTYPNPTLVTTAVTGKLLTGYTVGANSAIAATDSILQAFGKVQGQINGISAGGGMGGSGTINTIPKFTAATTLGNSLLTDNASTLSYISTATDASTTALLSLSSNLLTRATVTARGHLNLTVSNGTSEVGTIGLSQPGGNPGVLLTGNGTGRADIRMNDQNGNLAFATGTTTGFPATQMLLTTNGNTLIGTTTDDGSTKLQVSQVNNSKTLTCTNSGTNDNAHFINTSTAGANSACVLATMSSSTNLNYAFQAEILGTRGTLLRCTTSSSTDHLIYVTNDNPNPSNSLMRLAHNNCIGIQVETGGASDSFYAYHSASASGNAFRYQNDGVDKAWLNNAGAWTAQAFIKQGGLSTEFLMADGSVSTGGGGGGISGSGTTDFVPKWTGATSQGDSLIASWPSGTVGIGYASDSGNGDALEVNGSIAAGGFRTDLGTGNQQLLANGTIASFSIRITTSVSITSTTTGVDAVSGTGSQFQNGRNVIIANDANAINYTCNGGIMSATYLKTGTANITFVAGGGRTLVLMSGTAVLSGIPGSTAAIMSDGTVDYLYITNY